MEKELLTIRIGDNERLRPIMDGIMREKPLRIIDAGDISALQNVLSEIASAGEGYARILFIVSTDEGGASDHYYRILRFLRCHPDCLKNCIGGLVVDGTTELYTKSAACELVLAASMAGCLFIGKALVEGTGSLYNQHIIAGRWGTDLEEAYRRRIAELADRILEFEPPVFERPRIAVIHASENRGSNTLWIAGRVNEILKQSCDIEVLSLLNGTIYDCRGCSYETCLHFSENETCFYGGPITEMALPLIRDCDAILFLCPNYNDSVSANIMALLNRMNNLLLRKDLSSKYAFSIVVSGYSGSDIVARQLLSAVSLNKSLILPPYFCLMQTAHDPGSAKDSAGIETKISAFAENMQEVLLKKTLVS